MPSPTSETKTPETAVISDAAAESEATSVPSGMPKRSRSPVAELTLPPPTKCDDEVSRELEVILFSSLSGALLLSWCCIHCSLDRRIFVVFLRPGHGSRRDSPYHFLRVVLSEPRFPNEIQRCDGLGWRRVGNGSGSLVFVFCVAFVFRGNHGAGRATQVDLVHIASISAPRGILVPRSVEMARLSP